MLPMLTPSLAQRIEQALRGLRYGAVQIVIHNAQIVCVERIERIRLTGSPEALSLTPGRPTTTEVRHDDEEPSCGSVEWRLGS